MSHQMNMSSMPGIGAPGGAQQQMPNMGTPRDHNAPSDTEKGYRLKLHTYIYDYFLKTEQFDLARALHNAVEIQHSVQPKQSPDQKGVNGVNDLDKDKARRPDDLPLPEVPTHNLDSPFLFDWWCQFWDLFGAQRGKGNAATKQYLNNVQARMSNQQRMMRMDPQMQANMGMRNGMMPGNAMAMTNDMAKRMAMQNRQPTPQQMQQMQQFKMQQQMQMQQTQMQREGSTIDLNGQRPQSPGSVADAPSPKRQRLDGTFNGPVGPMGRGQPQGMPGQAQFNGMQMQNPQAKAMQQVYAQSMARQMQSAMDSDGNKGMPGNPPGLAQGSPAMDATNPDFFNAARMSAMPPGQGPPNNNSNHALQDYQMQLMLLEQQNKKRLLMARQEQDNMTNAPGGPAPPGQQGAFAPAMSPSGSRAGGPSPNPNDGMKRGTPKMAHGAVPSPTPDGPMGQGRVSPAPGFDPSQMNPNMPPGMFPQMNKMGMMGPNGQMMQPPSSHPAFNAQMSQQQQMDMFRAQQQQQNGARMPNGGFMGGPQQMMPGQQPGGPQQPPNMTPQQRNAMPPPPAPTGDAGRGTQPSSPQQQPAPPTPQQTNKANPKGRKDNKSNKKAPAKKGTGATPVSEADAPPTPTPAPPITPTQANANFPPKSGSGQPGGPQPPGPNVMPPQGQPDMGVGSGPFGHLDGSDFNGFSLDLGMDGSDVLDNFDFDSFLTNGDGDGAFGFDANMAFGDTGLEAGGEM